MLEQTAPLRPQHLVVGLVLVDHDRDPVVEERPPPEVGAVDLQQVARGPAQRRELAPAALAHQQRVRSPRLHQVDHLVHQVERQRPAVGRRRRPAAPAGTALRSPSKLLVSTAESPVMNASLNL